MNTYKILNKTLGAVALSILFSTNAIAQKQAAKDMKVLNKEIKKKGNKVNVYMDPNLVPRRPLPRTPSSLPSVKTRSHRRSDTLTLLLTRTG